MFQEQLQNLKRLIWQPNLDAAFSRLSCAEIRLEQSESDDTIRAVELVKPESGVVVESSGAGEGLTMRELPSRRVEPRKV
jgi:hypothetical protein